MIIKVVKMFGPTEIKSVEIDSYATIMDLKRFLASYWDIEDISDITLSQGGDLLVEDNATLKEYNIKEYDVIEVMPIRVYGG